MPVVAEALARCRKGLRTVDTFRTLCHCYCERREAPAPDALAASLWDLVTRIEQRDGVVNFDRLRAERDAQ